MQSFSAAVANTVSADLVARADGTPILAGTVTFYLIALTGTNAGKWFKTSDDSWSAVEAEAGAGAHVADGHWTCSIDAAAWAVGVRYMLYAKESGNLHIPVSDTVETAQTGDSYASIGTLITTVGAAGVGLSAIPKTGFKLASDGLDSIATTAPAGVAANFREMLVAVWRHCFKKRTFNANTGELKTFADNGTSVLTTQTCTDDGTTETQGAAS